MDSIWELLLKFNRRNKGSNCKSEGKKDKDGSANVLYESFEYGYKHSKQEVSSGICQMKHRNEL